MIFNLHQQSCGCRSPRPRCKIKDVNFQKNGWVILMRYREGKERSLMGQSIKSMLFSWSFCGTEMIIQVAVILSFQTIFSSPTYLYANKWSYFILLTLNKYCWFYLKCLSPSPASNTGFVLFLSHLSLRACFLFPFCLKDISSLLLLAPPATYVTSCHNMKLTMLTLPVSLTVSSETEFPEQTSYFISHLILHHCYCASFIDVQ